MSISDREWPNPPLKVKITKTEKAQATACTLDNTCIRRDRRRTLKMRWRMNKNCMKKLHSLLVNMQQKSIEHDLYSVIIHRFSG